MNLSRPIITPPEGMVSFETLREIARKAPQARISNVVSRLQALAVAEAMRGAVKPRVRVKAGRAQLGLVKP
jgi:hypothetical protein